MSSTFGSYGIAVSGMYVNQSALSVTSHNISNINTTGYSRQRVTGEEKTIVQQGGVSLGSGTGVQEICRARNQLLDMTYRQESATSGYWGVKSANLEDSQVILSEFTSDDGSSDNGLQQTIEEFFSSWEELAKDPSSLSNRQAVIESAKSFIETLSSIDEQLQELQADAVNQVTDGVAELNDLAKQVAELNVQIKQVTVSGSEASDLKDQRDTLIDNMSTLTSLTVSQQTDGTVEVSIGGVYLVQGSKIHTLAASGDGSADNPLKIQWSDLGQNAQITSGSIRAYWEDADQNGVESIEAADIPYDYSATSSSSISNLRQGLNDLLSTIADKVNSIHSSSVDIDGNDGLDFFLASDDGKVISISNIKVNPVIEDDTNKIAAASSSNSGDNTAATAIAGLLEGENFKFDGLSMDCNSFYQALISWIGTAGSTADSYCDTQSSLLAQIDSQRQSISGVSLDEEMANMIMFQNAYSASARVLSTIDGLVGDLIQELG